MAGQKKSQKTIEDAYQKALAQFGHRLDVTGVDIGYKYTEEQRTDIMSIRLHVKEKFPKSALEVAQIFPEEIDGFPVDVIQGNYKPGAVTSPQDSTDRTGRFSPLRPGISVAHKDVSAGTLGLIVRDDRSGKPAILSNWHVLVGNSSASPGDPVTQPGSYDGGRAPRDTIANLERMILDKDGDAAIAILNNSRPFDYRILDLGTIVGEIRDPRVGEIVVKSGRTTKITRGRVDGTGRYFITYSIGRVGVDGFIIVPIDQQNPSDEEISQGGDSGSAWLVDGTNAMVGLHFAGETDTRPSEEHGIACFATRVFARLSISLPQAGQNAERMEEKKVAQTHSMQIGEAVASSLLESIELSEIRRWVEIIMRRSPGLLNGIESDFSPETRSCAERMVLDPVAIGFAIGAATKISGKRRDALEVLNSDTFTINAASFLVGAIAGARAVDGNQ